ncbi:MAG: hypothetical protein A3F94_03265 [Candidatus Spechtbacteria bacterium RIFCSPLOWO2_12_FULL_38_22]|uniref:DNA polymerase III subunit delta n=1 Tax=Candidatus Spechtbacteria bacterium RIFCSPLOWO2_12_FULL_38_22 TaxID=1802165 RepID=A0A1G2HIN4_9BACT|nr:MAG: hypothetical protein A2728_03100 [Candidatus Spechtbacteria bacterium RIFCSPHIGHO2_01_FULL_38_11]OGZ60155.1 MAG: hypothetical protein A3E58_00425 [Candidatus Spechtbacteria bacterium RIFCSPHIGHO2_12_FULL_38_30]OGZ62347.1 MAG: hypothetical protein A3F94_03265 [Candidatus Spechtbacteria bacterium RIFCSPLOWO2_12_FULL_38_22]
MIIGHKKQLNILREMHDKNSLAHAYLFSGVDGIGKLNVAIDFGELLLKSDFNKSPDGYLYENGLTIEEARILKKKLALSPLNSQYKVVIINNASNIKLEAANAMLKILEEPSGDSIFFLLTSNTGLILPTIRSRCYTMNFFYVDNLSINEKFDTKKVIDLYDHWSGRPAYAQRLLEDPNYLKKIRECRNDAGEFFNKELNTKFKIIEKYSKTDTGLFVNILMEYLRSSKIQNKFFVLRDLFNVYKGLITTNFNIQFSLRSVAVKIKKP